MLSFEDHREDPSAWAQALSISKEAVDIYLSSDVLDLHIDTFIWNRIFGYDLKKRHGNGLFNARFYSQIDFPRILESQMTGATWIITTNPGRTSKGRARTFVKNINRLRSLFESVSEQFQIVRNVAEYRTARAAGKHGAFIGIQGGNALDDGIEALDLIPDDLILRITLVHLSSSSLGVTSSPLKAGADSGLTTFGKDYVRRLNEKKIFVDLAHISKRGFYDAVEVHDASQPLLVTHTGVDGVHEHWRNLSDDQLRAIADTGGTVGIMYAPHFLGDSMFGGRAASVIDHVEHIINIVGEDHASLGSDWDGAIPTPRDLKTCLDLPRLSQIMLDRGWTADRIQKVLGGNFLRVVEMLRG